jgi:hypothetical protein
VLAVMAAVERRLKGQADYPAGGVAGSSLPLQGGGLG